VTQSNKQLTLLTSPLQRIADATEATTVVLNKIAEVVLNGAGGKSGDTTSDELKKQTTILTDIRSILREQNKTLASGAGAKGGAAGGMFTPMSAKDVGLTALMIVGVAGAIVGAAALFTLVPVISIPQLLTVLAVAGIFALIAPTFVKIAEVLSGQKDLAGNAKGGDMSSPKAMFALAGATALMMVGIAISIVLSGAIFSLMPVISGGQFLTALAIALIMIPAAYAYSLILKQTKDLTKEQLIFAASAIPLMALGIVAAAYIFMLLPSNPPAPDPVWVLKSALAIGLFAIGFYYIMKAIKGATQKELLFGALAIPLIAVALVAISYIFMALPGNPMAPDPVWTLKSAFAIGLFAVGFYFIMKAIKGATNKELIAGALAIPLMAVSIVAISYIFMALPGNPMAPDPIWVLKSALAIGLFSVGFYFIMKAIKGATTKELIFGALAIPLMAASIVAISYIFMALPGNPMAPDPVWVLKSALAIGLFGVGFYFIMKAIKGATTKELLFGALAIPLMAVALVAISYIFMALPNDPMAPDPIWTLKSAFAIGLFGVGFYFIMKAIKGATAKELLFGALAIPIIAIGIVLTAWIFMALPSDLVAPDPMWVLKAGFAMLIFAIPFYIVSKAIKGMSAKELLFMAFAIPIIAFGVLATAWIFQGLAGIQFQAPEPMWSLKAALAIVLFGAMIYLSSKTIGKLGMKEMLKALLGVVVASFAVIAVAWLFSLLPGTFTSPPIEWTLAAAAAIGAFGVVIAAVGLAVQALTPATLLLGALGIIVIAITIVAVGWILSLLEPAMPALKAVASGFVDIVMAPVNGIIDAFARFKNEIGVENLIPLAVGVAALGGAWLIFSAAVAGGSVAGLLGSAAGAVGAIFDGIASLFGGDTPSPLDILKELAILGPQIQTLAAPLTAVGTAFAMINKSAAGVSKAFESVTKFVEDTDVDDMAANAKSLSSIANSYIKISNASKTLNVKAIETTTNMFKALTDLAKNNGESAMGILAEKLMVAVKELTAAAGNLEESVSKQGDATAAAGDAISGAVTAVKETVTGVKKEVGKMTADAKGAMDMTPLIDAIKALEDRFDTFITVKIKQ
jgi:hypothetical protein